MIKKIASVGDPVAEAVWACAFSASVLLEKAALPLGRRGVIADQRGDALTIHLRKLFP